MKAPKLTEKEWETIRHLLLHCGRYDHCGLTEEQVDVLYRKKLKLFELAEEHKKSIKFKYGSDKQT